MRTATTNRPSPAFLKIKAGLENAIAHAQGLKTLSVHEVELPDPPKPMSAAQITALRVRVLHVSQHAFARMLNASPQTIQVREQGRAKPTGTALRFLRIIEHHPDVLTNN